MVSQDERLKTVDENVAGQRLLGASFAKDKRKTKKNRIQFNTINLLN